MLKLLEDSWRGSEHTWNAAWPRRPRLCGERLLPTVVSSDSRMSAVIGRHDRFHVNSRGGIRRTTRTGHTTSLSLGRLVKFATADLPPPGTEVFPVTTDELNPSWCEWLMGYPPGWTIP